METRTYKVYKFNELPEDIQDKAIEKLYYINVDADYWYEYIVDDFKEQQAKKGYRDLDVYFSGFSSQGDGASFKGKLDIEQWLKSNKLITKYRKLYDACKNGEVSCSFSVSGHYVHEMCMSIHIDGYYPQDGEEDIPDIILEDSRKDARELYSKLNKEYDYQTSKEAIIEAIEANDYDFTEDGRID